MGAADHGRRAGGRDKRDNQRHGACEPPQPDNRRGAAESVTNVRRNTRDQREPQGTPSARPSADSPREAKVSSRRPRRAPAPRHGDFPAPNRSFDSNSVAQPLRQRPSSLRSGGVPLAELFHESPSSVECYARSARCRGWRLHFSCCQALPGANGPQRVRSGRWVPDERDCLREPERRLPELRMGCRGFGRRKPFRVLRPR